MLDEIGGDDKDLVACQCRCAWYDDPRIHYERDDDMDVVTLEITRSYVRWHGTYSRQEGSHITQGISHHRVALLVADLMYRTEQARIDAILELLP